MHGSFLVSTIEVITQLPGYYPKTFTLCGRIQVTLYRFVALPSLSPGKHMTQEIYLFYTRALSTYVRNLEYLCVDFLITIEMSCEQLTQLRQLSSSRGSLQSRLSKSDYFRRVISSSSSQTRRQGTEHLNHK